MHDHIKPRRNQPLFPTFNFARGWPKGQEQLKASSVLCIGAGGLGCPLLLYLAAAGVGRIGIVDFDVVDESNLQRQVLYGVSVSANQKHKWQGAFIGFESSYYS